MTFKTGTNPNHRAFYVSMIDGTRMGRAAGPYLTHQEALDDVKRVRDAAYDIDPRSWFFSWGTCSMPEHDGYPCPIPMMAEVA